MEAQPGAPDTTDADVAAILGVPAGRLASKTSKWRLPGLVYLVAGLVIGWAAGPWLTGFARGLGIPSLRQLSQPLRAPTSTPAPPATAASSSPPPFAELSPPSPKPPIPPPMSAAVPGPRSETIENAPAPGPPQRTIERRVTARLAERRVKTEAGPTRGGTRPTRDQAERAEAQEALALLH